MRAFLVRILIAVQALLLTGCAEIREQDLAGVGAAVGQVLGGGQASLSQDEIARGLRQALEVGTGRAVDELATTDAFYANPRIHIPLPGPLAEAQETLRPFGLASLLDDLELRLNRGAEQAMPEARRIFVGAISALTFDDVIDIWRGPDDAATRYFQRTTTSSLAEAMRGPVQNALNQAGAVRIYDQLVGQARAIPGVPNLRADLTDHVLDLALVALFGQLAEEEARIREDPLARSTELLRRVFGTLDA